MIVSAFKILIMTTMRIFMIAMMMMVMMMRMIMMVSTCSGEFVVKVRLCAEMMAEPPGLTSKPDRHQDYFRID